MENSIRHLQFRTLIVRTVLLLSCVLLAACATQPESRSISDQIDAPGQVGVIEIDGVKVGITKGVVDIIEEEGKVDIRDNRLRCYREKRTGTHLAIRLCRTVSEADDQAKRSREALERLHRRGSIRVDQ